MTERMMRHFSLVVERAWTAVSVAGLALGLAAGLAGPAQAQSSYAPVIMVNELGISGYELDQRARFMTLLGAKGDVRKMAEEALIEDRLRQWKARNDGIALSDAALTQGMTEFAARANLSVEDFTKALAQNGVDAQTFRDFVAAGMVWREVVKASYAGRIQISDAEVTRALALEAPKAERVQVLLSEVVVPVRSGREAEARAAAQRASAARTEADFAAVAREVSNAPTAAKGGRLDWMPIEALPAEVRASVMDLAPGRTAGPIETGPALRVFFLRGIDEGGALPPGEQAVGYAALVLGAPGAAETAALAARAEAQARSCDDLYTVAKALPAERLERVENLRPARMPADLAPVLARLDVGETQRVQRGGNEVLVMLCSRGRALDETLGQTAPSQSVMRDQLSNARVGALADALMDELKSDAVIVRK